MDISCKGYLQCIRYRPKWNNFYKLKHLNKNNKTIEK